MLRKRDVTLLISSLSARGKTLATGHTIARILRGGGWNVAEVVTTSHHDITEVAADSSGDYLAAIGGDGYLAAVANNRENDSPFIPFPGGSGNDLCRSVGIGNNPIAWAHKLAGANAETVAKWVRPLDGMLVQDARGSALAFGIVSMGIDATANQIANETRVRPGSLAYVWGATLGFLGKFSPKSVIARIDGEKVDVGGWLTAVSNTGWFGGGVNVAPMSRTDDGVLELIHVEPLPRFKVISPLTRALLGRGLDDPVIQVREVKHVEFLEPKGLPAFADGDVVAHVPLTVTAMPDVLSLVAPIDTEPKE